MVFELLGADGAFEARARRSAEIARNSAGPQPAAVEQTAVADRPELGRRVASIVAQGGEGLVLHLASADYRTGRRDSLVKLKPSLDVEATVMAHRRGTGKYQGALGALEVRMPEGRQFLIGTGLSDDERRHPPAVGRVLTYHYRDLTSAGLPRFASFLRLHHAL